MRTPEHTAGQPLRRRGDAAEGKSGLPGQAFLGHGRISRGLSRLSWSAVVADILYQFVPV